MFSFHGFWFFFWRIGWFLGFSLLPISFLLGTWRGVGEHCIASGLLCILSPSYVRLGVSLFLFKVVGKFVLVGMVAHFVLFFSHPSLLFFLSLGRSVCVSGALCIWVRASVLALVFCFCLGVLSLGVCSVLFGICRSCSTVGFSVGWRFSLRTFLFFLLRIFADLFGEMVLGLGLRFFCFLSSSLRGILFLANTLPIGGRPFPFPFLLASKISPPF